MTVTLHGPGYSTYARTARLALEEKGVDYTLAEVDILSGANQTPGHLARHPFGKVPAFEHDGFALFETFAIIRYVDEAFPGPSLQPADARERARMTQICAVLDSYGYGAFIGKLFWQLAIVPMQGGTPDQAVVADGLAGSQKVLDVIEGLVSDKAGSLCGGGVSLADLFLLPILEYVAMTPPGAVAIAARPKIAAWFAGFAQRPSVVKTRPSLG